MKEIAKIEEFIFDDNVQKAFSQIGENIMGFNILEITGMGNQEVKHSNILSWIFGENEHGLGNSILENFLLKVAKLANNKELKHYLYLPSNNRELIIYREKNNIDLLIVDNANNVVIAIENKIYSYERIDGDDGGQLEKYENIINNDFNGFNKYYIYLTVDLMDSSKDNWLNASYQMIVESISEVIHSKTDISTKSKIILESYIDLLKRRGIVSDDNLTELCEKIWSNKKYRDALNILIDNKPSNIEKISNLILSKLKSLNGFKYEFYGNKSNDIIFKINSICDSLYDEDKVFYNLSFYDYGITLAIYIDTNDKKLDSLYKKLFPKNSKRYRRNQLHAIREEKWDSYIYDISIESIESEVENDIELILKKLESTDKIVEKELETYK